MASRFRFPATALALTALTLNATTLHAQDRSFGLSASSQLYLMSDEIGAGDIHAFGARFFLAPSPWSRFGFGLSYANNATVEYGPATGRNLSFLAPHVDVEAALLGEKSQLFLQFSPTLMMFDLSEMHAAPAERVILPGLALGLGVTTPLFGPLSLDIAVSDFVSWHRAGLMESAPYGSRKISHSPRIEARLSLQFRKEERVARWEDLPISFSNDFRPIRISTIQEPILVVTNGREHVHIENNLEHTTEPPIEARSIEDDILLGTIYFRSGSFEIDSAYVPVLRDVAEFMRANPNVRIVAKGYTNPTGNRQYNLALAERRANSVRDKLVYYYEIDLKRVDAVTGGIDPESPAHIARRVEIRTRVVNTKPVH